MGAKYVYLLQHSYEYAIGNGRVADETIVLGIFATKADGKRAIAYYKTVKGFRDYPASCFTLDEYEIGKREWVDGFVIK